MNIHPVFSDALANLPEEASQRRRLLKVANTVAAHRLLSQQEAVYMLAGLPLRHSSRGIVFVNARLPANRTRFLRPTHELQQLDPGDEDVFKKGLIEHYAARPRTPEFERMTLAQFATHYSTCPMVRKRQDGYNIA